MGAPNQILDQGGTKVAIISIAIINWSLGTKGSYSAKNRAPALFPITRSLLSVVWSSSNFLQVCYFLVDSISFLIQYIISVFRGGTCHWDSYPSRSPKVYGIVQVIYPLCSIGHISQFLWKDQAMTSLQDTLIACLSSHLSYSNLSFVVHNCHFLAHATIVSSEEVHELQSSHLDDPCHILDKDSTPTGSTFVLYAMVHILMDSSSLGNLQPPIPLLDSWESYILYKHFNRHLVSTFLSNCEKVGSHLVVQLENRDLFLQSLVQGPILNFVATITFITNFLVCHATLWTSSVVIMVPVVIIVRSEFAAENSAHSLGAHAAASVHRTKCALDV